MVTSTRYRLPEADGAKACVTRNKSPVASATRTTEVAVDAVEVKLSTTIFCVPVSAPGDPKRDETASATPPCFAPATWSQRIAPVENISQTGCVVFERAWIRHIEGAIGAYAEFDVAALNHRLPPSQR